MKTFAPLSIKNLMKNNGAESISAEAVNELIISLEEKVREWTRKALEMMNHSRRKKLMKEDFELIFTLR